MPIAPPTAKVNKADDGVPTAKPERSRRQFRKPGPCDDLYETSQWRNFLRPAILNLNPICQFVDPVHGRCRRAAVEVHHRIGATRQNFFNWAILVCLCKEHHHKHAGDPTPRAYVPTNGLAGQIFEHGDPLNRISNFTDQQPAAPPGPLDGWLRFMANSKQNTR